VLTTLLDGRAFAERYGEGEPAAVALHGWARNRNDWSAVLTGLDLPALALDQPGFGATPAPDSAWGSPEYADWLAAILETLVDRPVLVGHSFGGRVAVQLAATRPELVRGVVLTGVPLYRSSAQGSKPRLAFRMARSAYANGLIGEERMEQLRRRFGSEDYRNAHGVMRDVLVRTVNEEYTAQVEAMGAAGVPTRLVWGEGDTAAPIWMAARAGEALGVTPTIVPGAAHQIGSGLVAALRTAIEELGAR
jgi:pimeloyl-ACP methyl ester carboxylesterase